MDIPLEITFHNLTLSAGWLRAAAPFRNRCAIHRVTSLRISGSERIGAMAGPSHFGSTDDPSHSQGDGTATASGSLGERASEIAGTVREHADKLAQPAIEKVREVGEAGKNVGAEGISGLARAVHNIAGEVEKEVPQVAPYMRQAADGIERASSALRERSIGDLFGMAEDFARREPVAFLGASVLVGFMLTRFLKSSASGGAGPS
jgi:hypothetical protein